MEFSEREILKKCNKNLVETGQDSAVVMFNVGYYEENSNDQRLMLEKLKAAEIIDYEVERFAWWEKNTVKKTVPYTVTKSDWWYGTYQETHYTTKYVTEYNFKEHFMVNVSLTDKTKKYALSHQPEPKKKEIVDKDFKQPMYYDSLYPENKVLMLSENWPEVPHPLANEIYEKCKSILAEAKTMLDQTIDDAYSKPEQKLMTLDKVDDYSCMTSVQKTEVSSERSVLQKRIDVMKGNEAFGKCKKIADDATALLEKAKTCRDLEKSLYKWNTMNSVSNYDKMSQSQNAELEKMLETFKTELDSKKMEFECDLELPDLQEEELYEEPDFEDDLDPQEIAYRQALERSKKDPAILFAYVVKAVVARDIKLRQDEEGTCATAEVIYELKKVTDAERVFNRTLNKQRVKGEATFNYFTDKGWVLTEAVVPRISGYKYVSETNINLTGSIGNNQVCMSLQISSEDDVKGAYYYKKNGPTALLYLKGEKEGSTITLTETNAKGKVTGTFEGDLSGNSYIGEFESYSGKYFDFNLQEDNSMTPIDLSKL